MVDFIDFLQYGFDESNAIYAQIYQIHGSEAKTFTTERTIHQEAGRNQKENIGNEHWWVWWIPH